LHEFEYDLEIAVAPRNVADLYTHLVDRGMVWEFRDLLQAHLVGSVRVDVLHSATLEPSSTSRTKLGSARPRASPAEAAVRLRERWGKNAEDESTLFALLDVFTNLALQARELPGPRPVTRNESKDYMKVADECGSALRALDEAHLMSRPCLRWTMARRMIEDDMGLLLGVHRPLFFLSGAVDPGDHGLSGFRLARVIFPYAGLPIYDASNGSIPRWKPKPVVSGNDFSSVANMVLRASEELGDRVLQTGCLQEMLYRGVQPPERVVSTLHEIWTSTENKRNLPWLTLFRALLAHTPSAREEIQRDLLLELGSGTKALPIHRLLTLAALSTNQAQQIGYRRMAMALEKHTIAAPPGRFNGSSGDSDYDSQSDVASNDVTSNDDLSNDDSFDDERAYDVAYDVWKGTNRPLEEVHDFLQRHRPKRWPRPRFSAPRQPTSRSLASRVHFVDPTPTSHLRQAPPNARETMARIKTEIRDLEHNFGREVQTLRNTLANLALNHDTLETDGTEELRKLPEEHGSLDDVAGPSSEKKVVMEPLPSGSSHNTTVEDYVESSDSSEQVYEAKEHMRVTNDTRCV
jgi:hypothetical protein